MLSVTWFCSEPNRHLNLHKRPLPKTAFKSLLNLTVDNDERSRLMAVLNQSLYLRYAETEDDPFIQK